METYFNDRAELCEIIVRFGFTDDILRSPEFAGVEGVELRDKRRIATRGASCRRPGPSS